ncbi:hypothetical protein K501DRAFT_266132 [Backusella circina FSU 941]|nr:hypothetical protein K501DRAFT_266132 [Backusella circina FSU 941]
MKHSVSIEAIEGALPELSVPRWRILFCGIRVSRVSFLLVELLRNCLSWVFMKTSQKVRVQAVPNGAATCLRDDLGSLAVWAGLSQSAGRFSLARLIAHVGWLYPSFVDLDRVCGLDGIKYPTKVVKEKKENESKQIKAKQAMFMMKQTSDSSK